jgi:hypothetical protein
MLNRHECKRERKNVMGNEIVGFDGLNYYYIIILSELAFKCVIGLDRFARISMHQWKWSKGTMLKIISSRPMG